MSDDDLIRRSDAEKAMLPFVHNVIADDAIAAIAALPAAPTFTAADLERAWEMGRDTLGSLLDHHPIYVSALAPPPADLAQRVKE